MPATERFRNGSLRPVAVVGLANPPFPPGNLLFEYPPRPDARDIGRPGRGPPGWRHHRNPRQTAHAPGGRGRESAGVSPPANKAVKFRAEFPVDAPDAAPFVRHSAIGQIAQLVEQRTENPRVLGSIPSLATIFKILRCSNLRRIFCFHINRKLLVLLSN